MIAGLIVFGLITGFGVSSYRLSVELEKQQQDTNFTRRVNELIKLENDQLHEELREKYEECYEGKKN